MRGEKGGGEKTYDKDLDKVQQNRLDALALPSHIRQCRPRPVPTRRWSAEEVRSEDDGEVRATHLIQRFSRSDTGGDEGSVNDEGKGEGDEPVEVTHEVLESRVVGVREVVHALVQSDVSKSIILDF